jgi:hypothetical protein
MSFDQRAPGQAAANNRLDTESEFPRALAPLAEQLRDDAMSLSRCYPPPDRLRLTALGAAFATTAERRPTTRRWLVFWGDCAATLAIAVLGWQAAARNGRHRDLVEHADSGPELPSRVAQLDDAEALGRRPTDEAVGHTRNVLKGLSGAEQEAVLDLLETHTAPQASLSI